MAARKIKLKSEDFFKKLKLIDPESEVGDFFVKSKMKLPLIFVSEDSLRLRRSISWMKESITKFNNCEITNYFANELGSKNSLKPIIEALKLKSLFGGEQIIVIHNAKKLKASSLDEITKATEQGPNYSLLILVCEDLSAALEKIGTGVRFEDFTAPKLSRWIVKEFNEFGFSDVSKEVVSYLVHSFNGTPRSALFRYKQNLYAQRGES